MNEVQTPIPPLVHEFIMTLPFRISTKKNTVFFLLREYSFVY